MCVPPISDLQELLAVHLTMLFTQSVQHEPPASVRHRLRCCLRPMARGVGCPFPAAASATSCFVLRVARRGPRRASTPSNYVAASGLCSAADGSMHARTAHIAAIAAGSVEASLQFHGAASR
jgi:hypothetical protein